MKTKLLALLLVLLLGLSSCDGAGSLGGEITVSLDRIVEGLQEGNVGLYESAFPSDFVIDFRRTYGDLNETLSELLAIARYKNQSDYGENWIISYEVVSKENLSAQDLPSSYALERFNDYAYTLPAEDIESAAKITVEVCFEGGMGEETFEIEYILLCMEGNWYLHPMHFGTVLKRT